jgi:hypothetical protein
MNIATIDWVILGTIFFSLLAMALYINTLSFPLSDGRGEMVEEGARDRSYLWWLL